MRLPRLMSLCLVLSLGSPILHADEVRLYRADETPDPREVAAILERDVEPVRPIKWRSIRLLPEQELAAAAPPPQADAVPDALALPVQFAFDSARILPEAMRQLDAVAEGIKLAGAGTPVLIEGHTDATGPAHYNEKLSLRRADAVKQYLVMRHGIAATALRTVGYGPMRPIDPANPYAGENRRVEFRADSAQADGQG